ncbi:MAG TPA: acyl carrier protein, partial [Terrimicrobiaceae bacterium]|nr:acyl carrier protein [Terrimicrobiaceae bacterium]
GGEGYVARNERVAEFLARQGTLPLSPGEVVALLETFLTSGVQQVMAIRVDWNKWRQFFRGSQDNPMLQEIFASGIESQENTGATSDWRSKIEMASPDEREGLIGQAVREVVGSVLRVKPESLRDDQPLTDLGLDSLMGAEIENSIESAMGVGLPPTSLMRARTVGQIAKLIAEHMSGVSTSASPAQSPSTPPEPAEEVDLDALSNEEIDRLLEGQADAHEGVEIDAVPTEAGLEPEGTPWLRKDEPA